MKTSGLFTLHDYKISAAQNKPFRLIFFGDIHRDSTNFAETKWKEFLAYAKSVAHESYFIGMGDYIDSMSTSERIAIAHADTHETTKSDLDGLAMSKIAVLEKELAFMRGRLIGLINGNHFYNFPSGINSDQKLCERLKCKYLGVSSFINLTIATEKNVRQTIKIWAHHGAGGARLVGGDINRIDQMREFADADVFCMGHSHKRSVVPANPRLRLENYRGKLKLIEHQQWLLRTGSFLAAYQDGMVSYNVDAARGPCSLGHVELEVTARRSSARQFYKDRHPVVVRRLDIRGIS